MERAEYLLLKILEQLRRNESKDQLLDSIKLLQDEIERSFPDEEPVSTAITEVFTHNPPVEPEPKHEEDKVFEVLQINEEEIDWEQEENGNILVADIENEEDEVDEEDEVEPKADAPKEATLAQTLLSKFLTPPPVDALLNPDFIEEEPVPPAVAPPSAVELKMDTPTPDVNQKWTATSPELMNKFETSPLKDLKKAIGINDRYRFINELFQGDETMYERSIKTINDFSIFPEAEFWIRRELKTKLGWNTDDAIVQQFDQLVRRRFS